MLKVWQSDPQCKPQRSELTNSEYLSWLFNLQDNLSTLYDLKEEGAKDELYYELEEQQNDLQDRFDNIPEQLQEGDAGQILQDRIDSLYNAMSELDCLEFPQHEDVDDEDLTEEEIDEAYEKALNEYVDAIDEIIQNIE